MKSKQHQIIFSYDNKDDLLAFFGTAAYGLMKINEEDTMAFLAGMEIFNKFARQLPENSRKELYKIMKCSEKEIEIILKLEKFLAELKAEMEV